MKIRKKIKPGAVTAANILTGLRIIFSAVILFCPVCSVCFYILYLTAGITDILDGPIARKTNTASEFGAALDTAADFVFLLVCLIKLIPILPFETWMYIWIAVIAVIKGINIVSGFVIRKRLVAVHSLLNKITGVLLFILPLVIPYISLRCCVPVVCSVATVAAIQEGHWIRTGR